MRTRRVLSLSLPSGLVREAERVAKEEFREALRRYLEEHRWRGLQRYGADRARRARVTEGDIDHVVQEFRRGR